MTRIAFLRSQLLLPVLIPLAALPLIWIGGDPYGAFSFLAGSTIIGGIPYAVFVGFLLVLLRGKSVRQHLCALTISPLLFVPVFSVFLLLIGFGDGTPIDWNVIERSLPFYAVYCLVVGYAYVSIGWGLYCIAKRFGLFERAA